MCIQDLQIEQRTTIRRQTVDADADGIARLPDTSRALWVAAYAGSSLVQMHYALPAAASTACPVDATMTDFNGNRGFTTRAILGYDGIRRLFVSGLAPFSVDVVWLEYDRDVDDVSRIPLIG